MSPARFCNAKSRGLRLLALTVVFCFFNFSLSACQSGSGLSANDAPVQSDTRDSSTPDLTPQSADLSADSLQPPEPVALTLSASTGKLLLAWDPIENQQSTHIYQFDPFNGTEQTLHSTNDVTQTTYSFQSLSHKRAWHRELIRVELCDSDNCISSLRKSISDLIEPSLQRLTPSVFIENERFAESIAVNRNATLMAAALPKQGAIDIYLKPADQWIAAQRTTLSGLSLSGTRELYLDVSASGDTLAVLIVHHNSSDAPEIRILERLGEGWFEIDRLVLDELPVSETGLRVENPIMISDNGDRLIINYANHVYSLGLGDSGWSSPSRLEHNNIPAWEQTFNERFAADSILQTMSASGSLDRIFLAHSLDDSLWLGIWQLQTNSTESVWEQQSAYPINAISPDKEFVLHSSEAGDQLFIAGWEPTQNADRTPVAWRYEVPESNQSAASTSLQVVDSIRFSPTEDTSATVRFSSDDNLKNVVLGWQSTTVALASPDASLSTYTYSEDSMRWVPKLELPEVYPTFAKQAFVRSTKISPDGNTMLISIAAGNSLSTENRVGELLSLH